MAFLDQVSALADKYFANGGMVAKFQVGGDVDPDDADSMDSGYDMSPSVSETAAMEDIGTVDEDRGPGDVGGGDDIDEDLGTFPEEAITAEPPTEDTGGDDDRVVSETFLGDDTPTAAEAIMKAQGQVDPAIQEAVKAQAAVQAARAARPEEKESVIEKLTVDEFGPLFSQAAPAAPTTGIGAALTEGYDMAGPAPAPADFDEGDLGPVSADLGALAKALDIDLKDVDLAQPGLAGLAAPFGVAKAIRDEFTGVGALRDAAAGGEVVRNEAGEVVGVVSRNEANQVTEVSPVNIKAAFDPALRDAYRELSATQQEEREARGDEPITEEDVAMALEEAEEKPAPGSQFQFIRFRPEDFSYFNPASFSYNQGISSLYTPRNS